MTDSEYDVHFSGLIVCIKRTPVFVHILKVNFRDPGVVHRAKYTVTLWCVDSGLASLYPLS